MSEAAILSTEIAPAPTPLAAHIHVNSPDLPLKIHAGSVTPQTFSSVEQELAAAIDRSAAFDLGYRTRIRVTGEDRLRWLNGMVSNAIQTLPQNHGNYNFILNSQGRIQGDAYIYRAAEYLLIDTDRSQAAQLFAHLDHFIIMDDVELYPLDDATTGIGLIGPTAAAILDLLGLNASALAPLEFTETALSEIALTLVRAYSIHLPRYELWFHPDHAATVWSTLNAAGSVPAGIAAIEALRVIEGTPRYGIDITDRSLPQQTSQTRALNFTKGCYLGQEIVERIRSRATVHRSLHQFALEGQPTESPVDLYLAEISPESSPTVVGQLTSIAKIQQPNQIRTFALGMIRTEAVQRKSRIEYENGIATVLEHPPPLI